MKHAPGSIRDQSHHYSPLLSGYLCTSCLRCSRECIKAAMGGEEGQQEFEACSPAGLWQCEEKSRPFEVFPVERHEWTLHEPGQGPAYTAQQPLGHMRPTSGPDMSLLWPCASLASLLLLDKTSLVSSQLPEIEIPFYNCCRTHMLRTNKSATCTHTHAHTCKWDPHTHTWICLR